MLQQKQVNSVLNKLKKRDSWFLVEYSVNPYEGCSCNCLYCYVRGSKYGENMADSLAVKVNAPAVLEKQLASRAKKNQYGFVAVGSATDAYIHHEETWRVTRAMLELLLKYRFPVFLSSKCTLIKRDIDLLKEIDKTAILPDDLKLRLNRGVILGVSVSTMDEKIATMLEPGAAAPAERMKMLGYLKSEGFLAGVNAMPLLPFISDTEEEVDKIAAAAKENRADFIFPAGLTLFGNGPSDSKTLYYKFIERYNPSLLPEYEAIFGNSFYPNYVYQQKLKKITDKICRKYNLQTGILS